MKHIPTRVVITILTFIIGITITANWWSRTNKRFADDIYFPAGTFSPHEEGLNWLAKYYSSSLAAMQELPLSSLKGEDAETYRFLWLRSFHPPVSIRLWRSGRQNYMSTKKLSGTGTPKNGEAVFPKTLAVNETRSLTEEEWKNFQELLRKAEFWSMPTVDNAPLGLDGAGWLLEGVKPDQYHVVHRQSPERGAYREVCVYLLGISRVKIDESKGELYQSKKYYEEPFSELFPEYGWFSDSLLRFGRKGSPQAQHDEALMANETERPVTYLWVNAGKYEMYLILELRPQSSVTLRVQPQTDEGRDFSYIGCKDRFGGGRAITEAAGNFNIRGKYQDPTHYSMRITDGGVLIRSQEFAASQ